MNTMHENIEKFILNEGQKIGVSKLSKFSFNNSNSDVFILKGSAGTGKTTVINELKKYYQKNQTHFVVCTPTNRSARIISEKTNYPSQTIHSLIYNAIELEEGLVRFDLKRNTDDSFKIYIVDESSLISKNNNLDSSYISSDSLLNSFVKYVKQGNNSNKIIFIGDDYQLPPVKEDFSPALNLEYLENHYDFKVDQYELTQVMRQDESSKVLSLATILRESIRTSTAIENFNIDILNDKRSFNNDLILSFDQKRFDAIQFICATN